MSYALPACANPITACPCAIKSGGYYTVSGGGIVVAASPAGDCIRVKVPGVTLDLADSNITLPVPFSSNSIGVHVNRAAHGTVVEGTSPSAPATVQGFAVGVQIDAPGVLLENIVAQDSYVGIKINGAGAYGSALTALGSQHGGIVVNGPGAGPYLTGVSVDNTRGFGIKLNHVKGAYLTDVTVTASDTYGLWLRASSHNIVAGFNVSQNTIAGVYLGLCHSGGLLSGTCSTLTSPPSSNGNILTSTETDQSTVDAPVGASQAYGVAIGPGNVKNRVVDVSGSGNGTYDAADYNPGCGNDIWTGDQFGYSYPSGSASCIH